MKISCIVHTRNSGRTLEQALASVSWADELIVVDMESKDDTLDIARRWQARILNQPPVPRVDGIRNRFLDQATHDWILVLDSDEYLADDGEKAVRELIEQHQHRFDAIAIPRFNTIAGRTMRGSNWYPDHQIRLFKKGQVAWSDSVHKLPEVVSGSHRLLELRPPHCLHIFHTNYLDIPAFVRRQVEYACSDSYDHNPDNFDFSDYLAKAYENLALYEDQERDGDLSHALSLLMAWDSIVRGLIHWQSLQPRPALSYMTALPIAQKKVSRSKIFLRKLRMRHYATAYVARRLLDIGRNLFRLGRASR